MVIGCFGYVLLFGAPYLPTLRAQQVTALELLDLKPGQTLVELGSGDGRMLAAAAQQGVHGIGYELNPLLVLYSRWKLRKFRELTEVRFANFWNSKLPECDGIYVFLLEKYMKKLDTKIIHEHHKPLRLVSFAFSIPNKKHVTEKNGLYAYMYD